MMDNRTTNNVGQFYWWFGVVEDRDDPLRIGRCRVRIMGYHIDSKEILPTEDLPWAVPIMPANNPSISGVGGSANGVVTGTWVVGFFADGSDGQHPMFFGTVGAVPGGPYGDPCAPAGGNSASDGAGDTGTGSGGIASGPFLAVSAQFIAYFEGICDPARNIGDGEITIGAGHVIYAPEAKTGYVNIGDGTKIKLASANGAGTRITRAQSLKLLEFDLQKFANKAKAASGAAWDKMNDNQKAAVISYTYNCGPGATKRLMNAGLSGAIMSGNVNAGADVFRNRGIKTGKGMGILRGLVKRRTAEAALFQNGQLP
jgi:GH24 family phage-related lysozyme (muramidase)